MTFDGPDQSKAASQGPPGLYTLRARSQTRVSLTIRRRFFRGEIYTTLVLLNPHTDLGSIVKLRADWYLRSGSVLLFDHKIPLDERPFIRFMWANHLFDYPSCVLLPVSVAQLMVGEKHTANYQPTTHRDCEE